MARLTRRTAYTIGLLIGVSVPAIGQAQTAPAPPAIVAPLASWLHEGSDIPADPAWTVGVLPNGVRYAVRRNATPPGTVAVRVRIDAGALMETDSQSGWAHLLEHMVFRGTTARPDGEAVKLWQRLGASFGSDSNAATTLRATTYKLDLPRADRPSVDEAVGALADMMRDATVDAKLLDIERKVVIAEVAARITPLNRRIQDASRSVLQTGLLAGRRDIGGTTASLTGASADELRAFHRRWYRPERAVVVMAGDLEPDAMIAIIKARFGEWKGTGAAPAEPAYGSPSDPSPRVAIVSDPLASAGMLLSWVTPHEAGRMTAERQRTEYLDQIALRVLNQRLSEQALKGGPMLGASAGISRARSLSDSVSLSVSPRDSAWALALDEAYGVLNRTLAAPVDAAEIAQQTAAVGESLNRSVATSATWSSAAWADSFVTDVDSGDVAATRRYYADVFAAQRATITPAAVQARLKTLFAPQPRAILLTPTAVTGGEATVAAALAKARLVDGGASAAVRAVTIDMVSPPLTPGTVVRERPVAEFGIDRVTFANGVELVMKKTGFAKESINVEVRIGTGRAGRPVNDRSPEWSAPVLSASGIGDATLPELARLTAGRQIGFGLGAASDATTLSTVTNSADVGDALRLMVAGATRPRFEAVALDRYRASYGASLRSVLAQPQSVFQVMGTAALFGGDRRFQPLPQPAEVNGATIQSIRTFWTNALNEGPVQVVAVGDFDRAALVKAVAATFGALPARRPTAGNPATRVIPPLKTGAPLILRHKGDPGQALVAVSWRTFGGLQDLKAARALSVATAILQDRLNADFRETQGGTYTPFVSASETRGFDTFGMVLAGAQLTPDRIGDFRSTLDKIIGDLASNGPSEDSLVRARETAVGAAQRTLAGNGYWSALLSRDLDDPRQLESIRTYVSGRRAVDAAAVRDVVKRYLTSAPLVIQVLPEAKPAAATAQPVQAAPVPTK